MTVHTFEGESEEAPERSYLLEINPNYDDGGTEDKNNVIDARWIDMDTGLFLDITAVRRHRDPTMGRDILRCKDSNQYEESDLYPLVKTTLNDVAVVVPSRPEKILAEKYGESSLTQAAWEGYVPIIPISHFTALILDLGIHGTLSCMTGRGSLEAQLMHFWTPEEEIKC